MLQFVINNWYLFVALAVILFLLATGPISQQMYGIRNANAAQAIQLLNRENGVVVDVCEPKEFSAGHVPNAINLPLSSLKDQLRNLEKHKNKPIIVSCRSGNRSLKAAVILRKHGFATVYNLAGGLQAWERDNLPLEK
ncbi:sulfurtransferase [Sulfuricaulis limicola]|uniref:Sulfurtransferase n=1 Tax=Sulfuricaulis limicola TaxID=1620215 RepID=A0A1B4XD25_9GAMM|nr:rhodanese-like domain-containing protein [Sulfuricaulis limicola]BAV32690.1 sulfurtransferase [Sulfuricaulis limicola]